MTPKNPAAVALGSLGGKTKSPAKARAAQLNGAQGGRPAKARAAIARSKKGQP